LIDIKHIRCPTISTMLSFFFFYDIFIFQWMEDIAFMIWVLIYFLYVIHSHPSTHELSCVVYCKSSKLTCANLWL
jgi:hypothetical protein